MATKTKNKGKRRSRRTATCASELSGDGNISAETSAEAMKQQFANSKENGNDTTQSKGKAMVKAISGLGRYRRDCYGMPTTDHALPVIKPTFDLPKGVTLSRTALVLPPDLAIEDWEAVGINLQHVESSIQFWVGDWWHYGFHRYGERTAVLKAKALCKLRWEFGTLMNWGWVCGKVETSRRREVLSFTHHAVVAKFDAKQQEYWLARAVQMKWSSRKLEGQIFEADLKGRSDEQKAQAYVFNLFQETERSANGLIGWKLETATLELIEPETIKKLAKAFDEAAKRWTSRAKAARAIKYKPREPIDPNLPKRHSAHDDDGNSFPVWEYPDGRTEREPPADGKWTEADTGDLKYATAA
jgi:hypothetical protein